MKINTVQLNLKNCLSKKQFKDFLLKSIDFSEKPDLVVLPENINLCLLFAKKESIQLKSIRNKFEQIFDFILSKLNLTFLFKIFDIENQKNIIIETLKELAFENNCYISSGTYYHKKNNEYHNSYSLISPKGEILFEYDKYKLLGIEKALRIQSVNNPNLIKTEIGNISMCICYDLNDKEYIKSIAHLGCDLLIAPSNGWRLFPGYPFNKFKERPQVQRSQENNIYITRPYCSGWLLPLLYFQGHSHIVDRNGNTLAESKTRNKTENLITDILL